MQIILMAGLGIVVILIIVFIICLLTGTTEKNLEKTLTKYGNVGVRAQYNIINNNEEILRETANKTADIHKDAVKTVVHSIKEGLSNDNTVYCKHCGSQIDADSSFCKKCGEQIENF